MRSLIAGAVHVGVVGFTRIPCAFMYKGILANPTTFKLPALKRGSGALKNNVLRSTAVALHPPGDCRSIVFEHFLRLGNAAVLKKRFVAIRAGNFSPDLALQPVAVIAPVCRLSGGMGLSCFDQVTYFAWLDSDANRW